ncbi:ribonuclease E inhibitor RraA/Dimethylmenaquinone methyltransferase [Naematelia encephala]|uniref:Ribonuclease E inhibitor RraA/Dimethylmenaquinone methyltransferase n=1 Tax=Naematelia encephala TaxID=71784 RepID=A0A1Y2BGZ4_9TREE|nr:ribonuclease E inhibitor RraA/Dimethylmenaquinone methyltransferase [Naematelia encephala]
MSASNADDDLVGSDLSALRQSSACEISDALLKLGAANGGLLPDLKMYSPDLEAGPHKIVGRVFTVKMVLASDTTSPKPDAHFVDACPRGSVIVISAPRGLKSACWGGLMSTAASVKGVLGAVVDGGCRDLTEHRELGFPVFARNHSTLGQGTFTRPSELNIPITINPQTQHSDPPFQPVTIKPGDVVVCDVDGCVVVPQGRIKEVVEQAAKVREVDEKIRLDLLAGKGVAESFKKWRT